MGSFSSKNEGYVNIETNSFPEEYTIIIQCTRKNIMLKQLYEYIKNTDQYSVYHKHFVNSKEVVSLGGITKEREIRSTMFFTLWSIDTTEYENNMTTEWIN